MKTKKRNVLFQLIVVFFLLAAAVVLQNEAWSKEKKASQEQLNTDSVKENVESKDDAVSDQSKKPVKWSAKNKTNKTVTVESDTENVSGIAVQDENINTTTQKPKVAAKKNVKPTVNASQTENTAPKIEETSSDKINDSSADETVANIKADEVSDDKSDEDKKSVEDEMIHSMMNNFPQKSDFIANEDKKSGDVLPVTNAKIFKANNPVEGKQTVSLSSMFVKMISMTVVMVLVIMLLVSVWKLIQKKKSGLADGKNFGIKVLSQQFIGNKSKIIIIETLGKRYLVGATDSNIQLLADIDFLEPNTNEMPVSSNSREEIIKDSSDHEMPANDTQLDSTSGDENFDQVLMVDLSGIRTSPSAANKVKKNEEPRLGTSAQIQERLKGLKKLG